MLVILLRLIYPPILLRTADRNKWEGAIKIRSLLRAPFDGEKLGNFWGFVSKEVVRLGDPVVSLSDGIQRQWLLCLESQPKNLPRIDRTLTHQ